MKKIRISESKLRELIRESMYYGFSLKDGNDEMLNRALEIIGELTNTLSELHKRVEKEYNDHEDILQAHRAKYDENDPAYDDYYPYDDYMTEDRAGWIEQILKDVENIRLDICEYRNRFYED